MFGEPGVGAAQISDAEWQKLPWVPSGVEHPRFESSLQTLRGRQLRIQSGRADLEMRVQGLARDEEAHDFAGPFEDGVDATIAHKTFDGDRFFAARAQRVRC